MSNLRSKALDLWADNERHTRERDEARAVARILAHAYEHDSRPPPDVVRLALSWPVETGDDEP